ncbi:ComE operon protein 2, partial [Bacillus cereus]|nr:ComE operon protein 2 [Bacillus cereus]
ELFEKANVTVKHVPLEYDIAALEDQKRHMELKELFASLEKENLSMEELQHVFTKAKMML